MLGRESTEDPIAYVLRYGSIVTGTILYGTYLWAGALVKFSLKKKVLKS